MQEATMTAAAVPLSRRLRGQTGVRVLVAMTAVTALVVMASVARLDAPDMGVTLRWWTILPMVYLAEMMVVHLRYRREAHSFSLSEIPIVLGLFFAPPLELVFAVLAGNLLVLTLHRRQPPIKLAFNLAQFSLVTGVGIVVFRIIAALGDPAGPAGWIAAFAATLVALTIAGALVNQAIELMGAEIDQREVVHVLALSAAGALVNTSLALVGVKLLLHDASAVWLAAVPPAIVFLAYRSYVAQMSERARLKALYEATLDLHNAPQIETALVIAARHARQLVDAEFAEIVVFPTAPGGDSYLTALGPGDRLEVMRPVAMDADGGPWAGITNGFIGGLIEGVAGPTPLSPPVYDGMVVPLVDGQTRVIGMIVAANRLGDVDSFTQEDRELLETLASRVSVALENGRLEDSLDAITELKNQLEEAARSKDQFIASISHELRTPLTAVVGLSHELTAAPEMFGRDETDEFIRLIAQQASELSYIVEDLLVAARADAGTLNLVPEVVDLRDTILAVVEAQFPSDRPELRSIPGPGKLLCWADPFRVRQIVRNLVTNATRYGGDGIWIRLEEAASSSVVVVSDDGPGVPAGDEEAIFEPYHRSHSGVAQPTSVGLGLAVARQLAGMMGGDLTYRRARNRTEFALTLPSLTHHKARIPSEPAGVAAR
jgi:signal transduction histidine kinase